ncbi:MAG: caspase family protein [Flavobacteriaceae bacterium]|nr:caspase family protein [Flavobacteriaceae bacterium]
MKKALVVGINHYQHVSRLYGCVNDARTVAEALGRNGDGRKNFDVKLMVAEDAKTSIQRRSLKQAVMDLFADNDDVALFYCSSHGYVESTGGFVITSDCRHGDEGLSLNELLQIANDSPAKNKLIILDCCHSGFMGKTNHHFDKAYLSEGLTILTASTQDQYAYEVNGSGIFTSLFVEALNGSAANLLGEVSPASIYSQIDMALGAFEQRPLFKTNTKSFVSLKTVKPPIELELLHKLVELFPTPDYDFPLDPTYEFTEQTAKQENVEKLKILQKYNRVNLVVPVGEEHMYFAAINSKSCRLTNLGKRYWSLVKAGRI